MIVSTVTSKGQTTLPKSIREALGVVPGDRVRHVILDNNEVRMMPVQHLSRLLGVGYSRQQFYEIRRNFQTYGAQGLLGRLPGPRGPDPNRVAAEVEEAILAHAMEHSGATSSPTRVVAPVYDPWSRRTAAVRVRPIRRGGESAAPDLQPRHPSIAQSRASDD